MFEPQKWQGLQVNYEMGSSVGVFANNQKASVLPITIGTEASPDVTPKSSFKVSRTLSVKESEFSGDGAGSLGAICGSVSVLSTSNGQGIGVVGASQTAGVLVGEHSQADAVGVYGLGRSLAGSTRAGIGFFANGRRDGETGIATGIEIAVENASGVAGTYEKGGASNTKGIWLHPSGNANSGVGLQIGHPAAVKFEVGIGINENSVEKVTYQDNSKSETGIQIKGEHSKAALTVEVGSGIVVLGNPEKNFAGEQLLEVFFGESALDPGVVFGTGKGKSVSILAIRNSTGQAKIFASNANNAFLTGTVQGDTGINFTAGKIFHIGAQTKESKFRVSESGLGFFGHAPAVQPTGVAETAAAIITALKSIGIFG